MIKLNIEDRIKRTNPSPDEIAKLLSKLDRQRTRFAYLLRTETDFIQTYGNNRKDFKLEYHTPQGDHFVCSKRLVLSDVIQAFLLYEKGDKGWSVSYHWERWKDESSEVVINNKLLKFIMNNQNATISFLMLLVFIAGGLGVYKVISFQIGCSMFFLMIALAVSAMTTIQLLEGGVEQNFKFIKKSEDPYLFWSNIVVGYFMVGMFVVMAIVAYFSKQSP